MPIETEAAVDNVDGGVGVVLGDVPLDGLDRVDTATEVQRATGTFELADLDQVGGDAVRRPERQHAAGRGRWKSRRRSSACWR